ncbi:unnamed protein product, partial [Rotaria sp. Silwood1]
MARAEIRGRTCESCKSSRDRRKQRKLKAETPSVCHEDA